MAVSVRFFTLSGKFESVKTETFPTTTAALNAAKAYAEPAGYTNIKIVDGCDPYDGFRITGKTPGGRAGRNIADGDWVE